MNLQNGNVTSTLFSLYDELMVAKATLEEGLTHSPGWLETRKKHRKEGAIDELYYIYLLDGKRHYEKVDPASKQCYLDKIETSNIHKQTLKNINEQLRLLAKCFVALKIDPAQRKRKIVTKSLPTNAHYQEALRHRTLSGELVRSKSEALLANLLFFYQVTYEYEKPLTLGTYTVYPDFTITLPTGKNFYWEHLGMLNDPKYAKQWAEKNHTYRQHGISEGNGLIITKDIDGVFDEQDALLKIKSYHLSPLEI